MHTVLLVIHILITLALIAVILIQRSDSDGAVLGSGGSGGFMTGRATANLLTRTTAILATLFILTSIALTKFAYQPAQSSILDHISTPAPATTNGQTPAAAPATPAAPVPDAPATPAVPKPQ